MTTLSTHDTKRSEDVRARLAVLSELPERVGQPSAGRRWTADAPGRCPDAPDRPDLLWQTLVGAWPIEPERLARTSSRPRREAKARTSWTDPGRATTRRRLRGVAGARATPTRTCAAAIAGFVGQIAPVARAATRSAQKLVQLTMPGVPDVYQGTELSRPVPGRPGQPAAGRLRRRRRPAGRARRQPDRAAATWRGEAAGDRDARCGCAATTRTGSPARYRPLAADRDRPPRTLLAFARGERRGHRGHPAARTASAARRLGATPRCRCPTGPGATCSPGVGTPARRAPGRADQTTTRSHCWSRRSES